MQIVILDGVTTNPGDLSWEPLERLGSLAVFDRTAAADVVARAAAEVVAAAGSAEAGPLPEEVEDWLASAEKPAQALVALAREAVIRLARTSDLRDLMRRRGRIVTWIRALDALARRLGEPLPRHLIPPEEPSPRLAREPTAT